MNPKKWTLEEEFKTVNLLKDGESIKNIAITLGRNDTEIISRLNKIIYENIEKGMSIREISDIMRISEKSVIQFYKDYLNKKKIKTFNNNINGGNIKINNNEYFDKIKRENELMTLIIENKDLHKKLDNLIISGNIHPNIKKIIQKI
jgi:hypothetical protein